MKYELELIISMILAICFKLFQKKIEIDIFTLTFVASCSSFLPILLKNIYNYRNNKELYKVEDNDLGLTNNPFENIFTKGSFKLGLLGTIMFLTFIFSIKKLPANFALPLGLLWMIFALIFNYYLRGVPIIKDDVIGLGIVLLGLFVMQYEKIFKEFKFENKFIVPIVVLIISQIINGYFVVTLKKYEDKISIDHLQLIDMANTVFLSIFIYLIYIANPGNTWKVSHPKGIDVAKLALIASTFGYLKQELKFKSQKNLPQNYFTVLSSLRIIVTLSLCWLFMGEQISIYNVIGAVIVISGLLFKNIEEKVGTYFYHDVK